MRTATRKADAEIKKEMEAAELIRAGIDPGLLSEATGLEKEKIQVILSSVFGKRIRARRLKSSHCLPPIVKDRVGEVFLINTYLRRCPGHTADLDAGIFFEVWREFERIFPAGNIEITAGWVLLCDLARGRIQTAKCSSCGSVYVDRGDGCPICV